MREKLEQSDNEQTKTKKQRQQQQMTVVKKKKLTLEEWFLASSLCRNDDIDNRKLLTDESGRSDVYDPCLCRKESSGKVKKRASFKLQEEADIFIFCSPDHQGDVQEESRI
ncbi:uncharacterized protein LOC125468413 [Pyrus x bretschneideri]|uniref:uncharacterized protein LOC125468413 n=1 Tax=Pyrus x bretschneideri TaxID=225117 RepID=UPI00202EA5AB|nr:uncharacterized protein LOC125468413 [Pyrus x bretschneideri]